MDEPSELKDRSSEEAGEDLRDRLSAAADQARLKGQQAWEDVSDLIREHPGASLGAAFVAGLLIGGILAGRSSGDDREPASERARETLSSTLSGLREVLDQALAQLKS